jgi:hypothetical protein
MILNEGELGGNKEIFNKYKEKLIDYEFSYDPKPSESLDILMIINFRFNNFFKRLFINK